MKFLLLIILPLLQYDSTQVEINVAIGQQPGSPSEYVPIDAIDYRIGQSYWVKVSLRGWKPGTYVIKGGNWYMRSLSFYDHQLELLGKGNSQTIQLNARIDDYYIFYPFRDEKDKQKFSISIVPLVEFLKQNEQKNIVQISFQAVLLFLFFISLFFAVSSKDKVYYFYCLYLLSICCFFGYQYGLLGELFPIIDSIPQMWIWLCSFTLALFYALFTISFLNVKQVDPKAYRVLVLGIGYILFLACISFIFYGLRIDVQHSVWFRVPLFTIEALLIGITVYKITRFPGKVKNYYLLGVSILLIVLFGAQLASSLQYVENFNNPTQAGLILEVFILSLGLGVRVNEIQKARNRAQEDLIHQMRMNDTLQKTYSEQLETQVTERTFNLQKKNEENELLIKEIHHRVKNNLQIVTSMISMQERRSTSKAAKNQLSSTRNKIKSISLIHEHLYSTDHFAYVNLQKYLLDLIDMLIKAMHKGNPIKLETEIEEIQLGLNSSIFVGLIVNELVTNSLKYAFKTLDKPQLKIVMTKKDNDTYHLEVTDNGPGADTEKLSPGLGYTIIKAIIDSAEGVFEQKYTPKGYSIIIDLKLID